MIGFGSQNVVRRPIYSATGIKLGYIEGEWWTSVDGRKIARITASKEPILAEVDTSLNGGSYITRAEIDENC